MAPANSSKGSIDCEFGNSWFAADGVIEADPDPEADDDCLDKVLLEEGVAVKFVFLPLLVKVLLMAPQSVGRLANA